MNVFEMVVTVTALALIAGVVNNWIKARANSGNATNANNKDDSGRIAKLEKRIQVLERIVTDRRHGLSDEINRLDA